MSTIYEVSKGLSIYNATKEMIERAKQQEDKIYFNFNDIILQVSQFSAACDICEIYDLKHRLRQLNPNDSLLY